MTAPAPAQSRLIGTVSARIMWAEVWEELPEHVREKIELDARRKHARVSAPIRCAPGAVDLFRRAMVEGPAVLHDGWPVYARAPEEIASYTQICALHLPADSPVLAEAMRTLIWCIGDSADRQARAVKAKEAARALRVASNKTSAAMRRLERAKRPRV